MDEIIIRVFEATEEGYQYDLFTDEKALVDEYVLDGGLCTGSMQDAIEMAMNHAKDLVASKA